jgi:hypothetical protein
MTGEIIDGETGDPVLDTAAPEAPRWPGRPLEVFRLGASAHADALVLFHQPGEDEEHYLSAEPDAVVDLEARR